VEAARPFQVPADAAGVAVDRGEPGVRGEPGGCGVAVGAGVGEELGGQDDAHAGHAEHDVGEGVADEGVGDLGVDGVDAPGEVA
jgi:hypothetical protein